MLVMFISDQEMLLVCMIGQREGYQSVTGLSTLPRPYKTPWPIPLG